VTRLVAAAACALFVLAVAAPARAQGNSQGKGKGHQSSPPSSSPLLSSAAAAPAASAVVPLAWVDDATVLPPGTMAVSVSAMRWEGTDVSEVDVPIVGVTMGLAPRVQLGASIPHVVGSDLDGVVGGVGTSFVSAKIGLLNDTASSVKLAIAPTLEILGEGALQGLTPGTGRTQFGLPAMLEVVQGRARVFASAGFFSQGIWFAGAGAGVQATPRVGVSLAFSRAWSTDGSGVIAGDRRELSGGLAFSVRPQVALFGSLGRTVATTDQNGAGTTVSAGVLLLLAHTALK
jgi:hypothetical protein